MHAIFRIIIIFLRDKILLLNTEHARFVLEIETGKHLNCVSYSTSGWLVGVSLTGVHLKYIHLWLVSRPRIWLKIGPLDKSVIWKIIFLLSQPKRMLWVLKKTPSQ